MASDKTKIKTVLPKIISGVSKVFEETLLEGLADSPSSSSVSDQTGPSQAVRLRNLLTLNRGMYNLGRLLVWYYKN